MGEKKSLVEEALLQMENLQNAITENAKGILASTMREEIAELVKESISDEENEIDVNANVEEIAEQDLELGDEDENEDVSDVEDLTEPEVGDIESDELDIETPEGETEFDFPDEELEDEPLLPLDLTQASDEEILKVYKAMGEEDGIIVTKDDDEIYLKDKNADVEYEIHTSDEFEDEGVESEIDMETPENETEDIVYEIELDEETEEDEAEKDDVESEEDEAEDEEIKPDEGEMKEVARSHSSLRKVPNAKSAVNQVRTYAKSRLRPSVKESKMVKDLREEVENLKSKNEEYRKALHIFKDKINEVAVFNSNLAYATRLFTEHTTTKKEKINILRRFDSVETIKESKTLYKTIKEELDGKTTEIVKESVQSKIQKSPSKGSATNLIENKTYEDPNILRIKDLMHKIK